MTQFKVFKHPSGVIEAVKHGWSWPAFFFTYVWAFVKQQWRLGFGLLCGLFALVVILDAIGIYQALGPLIFVLMLLVKVLFGIHGNSWRERNLLSRGYEHVDTIGADNPYKATALSLKSADGAL